MLHLLDRGAVKAFGHQVHVAVGDVQFHLHLRVLLRKAVGLLCAQGLCQMAVHFVPLEQDGDLPVVVKSAFRRFGADDGFDRGDFDPEALRGLRNVTLG